MFTQATTTKMNSITKLVDNFRDEMSKAVFKDDTIAPSIYFDFSSLGMSIERFANLNQAMKDLATALKFGHAYNPTLHNITIWDYNKQAAMSMHNIYDLIQRGLAEPTKTSEVTTGQAP